MRKLISVAVISLLLLGCGEPPAPVGPAAEATTPEIIISEEAPKVEEPSKTSSSETTRSVELALVEVEVPGMS